MSIRLPSVLPLRICSVAVLLSLASSSPAGEKLTMKFEKGETYAYRITQNMSMESEAQGQKANVETGQTLFVRTAIKGVAEDGSARAEQIIDRVQMKMVASGPVSQTIEFDSDSDEEPTNPLAKQVADNASKMVGEAISMTLTPQGQIKDVVIPESLQAPQQAGPARPGAGDQLRQMFEQSGLRLSEKVVDVGDTWEHKVDPPLTLPFGTLQVTTTYKYEGTGENGLHQIGATMDINLEPTANPNLKVTTETKEATGSFLFDNEAGRLQQSTVKQVMVIDLNGLAKQNITTLVMMELLEEDELKPASDRNQ